MQYIIWISFPFYMCSCCSHTTYCLWRGFNIEIIVVGRNCGTNKLLKNEHKPLLSRQTLLELGASPDYKDSRGLSALYHTAMVGGDSGCCELLLHEHASINCQDENGWHEVHQVTFDLWYSTIRVESTKISFFLFCFFK